jgi:hypothetical protein
MKEVTVLMLFAGLGFMIVVMNHRDRDEDAQRTKRKPRKAEN